MLEKLLESKTKKILESSSEYQTAIDYLEERLNSGDIDEETYEEYVSVLDDMDSWNLEKLDVLIQSEIIDDEMDWTDPFENPDFLDDVYMYESFDDWVSNIEELYLDQNTEVPEFIKSCFDWEEIFEDLARSGERLYQFGDYVIELL